MTDEQIDELWLVYDNAGRGGSRGSRTDFVKAIRSAVATETEDLRDAIRIMMARMNVVWFEVPQSEVDDFLKEVRKHKARLNSLEGKK